MVYQSGRSQPRSTHASGDAVGDACMHAITAVFVQNIYSQSMDLAPFLITAHAISHLRLSSQRRHVLTSYLPLRSHGLHNQLSSVLGNPHSWSPPGTLSHHGNQPSACSGSSSPLHFHLLAHSPQLHHSVGGHQPWPFPYQAVQTARDPQANRHQLR